MASENEYDVHNKNFSNYRKAQRKQAKPIYTTILSR